MTAQSADVRTRVERIIIVRLVGAIAAEMLAPRPEDYTNRPVADELDREALERPGPRIAELVVADEASEEPVEGDEAAAFSFAIAFADINAGWHYLEWLRAQAREFVVRYRSTILRVADALERHEVLRGDEVAALVYPNRTR